MKTRNTLIGLGTAAALAAAVGAYSFTASAQDGADYAWGMMGGYGPGYTQGDGRGYGRMRGYGLGYGHMYGYGSGNRQGQGYGRGYHMRAWGGGYGSGMMSSYGYGPGYGHGMMGW